VTSLTSSSRSRPGPELNTLEGRGLLGMLRGESLVMGPKLLLKPELNVVLVLGMEKLKELP